MFIDEAKIHIKAGDGGRGGLSFRREKYVPEGGPDGGNGGKGGDIVLKASERLKTLLDFRYRHEYRADNGRPGSGNNRTGANGQDKVLLLPVGTQVKDADTSELLTDFIKDEQIFIAAKGGRGGKGNAHFATATHRTPREFQEGTPGQEKNILLELKLIADVGIIGFPNVGKSTLISKVSGAKPIIANYPFTTLTPHLGVVSLGIEQQFTLADIPGIIEGAHKGVGLGLQFLRHVERTRLLIHLIDVSPYTMRDPVEDYRLLNEELASYSSALAEKKQLVVANKIDAPGSEERLQSLIEFLDKDGIVLHSISSLTGEGVKPLMFKVWESIEKIKAL